MESSFYKTGQNPDVSGLLLPSLAFAGLGSIAPNANLVLSLGFRCPTPGQREAWSNPRTKRHSRAQGGMVLTWPC